MFVACIVLTNICIVLLQVRRENFDTSKDHASKNWIFVNSTSKITLKCGTDSLKMA